MKLQKVNRSQTKIKMALNGPSGAGKTYSSLLLAYGLCGDWSKIALIDTENSSASLYANLGDFSSISLAPPFSPENYIKAIELCEKESITVIIIDSITHCWEYLLDVHSNMLGNSFTNWGKITPRHNAFVQKILQTPMHVIASMRTKTEYVLNEKNGKFVPEKMGMKSIQRDGMEYEFTLVFDLDTKHKASVSKDRTNLFTEKDAFIISAQTGQEIKAWCEIGTSEGNISERINECTDMKTLLELYYSIPGKQAIYDQEFKKRKSELALKENPTSRNHVLSNEPINSFNQIPKGRSFHE
jgi:hypothetical protein